MADDGIVIGWQQIYDKLVSLDAIVHQHMGQQTTEIATLTLRVTELEKDAAKAEAKRDSSEAASIERERQAERDRVQLRRMVWLALIGVFGSIIAAVAPLLIHH